MIGRLTSLSLSSSTILLTILEMTNPSCKPTSPLRTRGKRLFLSGTIAIYSLPSTSAAKTVGYSDLAFLMPVNFSNHKRPRLLSPGVSLDTALGISCFSAFVSLKILRYSSVVNGFEKSILSSKVK